MLLALRSAAAVLAAFLICVATPVMAHDAHERVSYGHAVRTVAAVFYGLAALPNPKCEHHETEDDACCGMACHAMLGASLPGEAAGTASGQQADRTSSAFEGIGRARIERPPIWPRPVGTVRGAGAP